MKEKLMSLQGHVYQESLVIGASSTFVGLVHVVPALCTIFKKISPFPRLNITV